MGYEQSLANWRLWRDVASDDTVPTVLAPSDLAKPRVSGDGVIACKLWSQIHVKFFGVGSQNAQFGFDIVGWMDSGPGDFVAHSTPVATVGTHTFTEPLLPGQTAQAWREWDTNGALTAYAVATLDLGTVVGIDSNKYLGHRDQVYYTGIVAATPQQTGMMLPTFGFTYLQLFLTLGTVTRAAAIWRPVRKYDT